MGVKTDFNIGGHSKQLRTNTEYDQLIQNYKWAQECSDKEHWSTEPPEGTNRKKEIADGNNSKW